MSGFGGRAARRPRREHRAPSGAAVGRVRAVRAGDLRLPRVARPRRLLRPVPEHPGRVGRERRRVPPRHLPQAALGARRRCPRLFNEDPVETFRRNIWINPFWEDDVNEVVECMGADRVIFGSDWPHIEGMPEPLDYLRGDEGVRRRRPALHPARQRRSAEHTAADLTAHHPVRETMANAGRGRHPVLRQVAKGDLEGSSTSSATTRCTTTSRSIPINGRDAIRDTIGRVPRDGRQGVVRHAAHPRRRPDRHDRAHRPLRHRATATSRCR